MADQFPDFPRAKLLFDQPLVIEPLSRITATLKDGTSLWIQREDCTSGLALGGNKVRKLEYVIADALAQGADTLVTTGGVQSNHMSQTSAAAARYGLKVALYPRHAVDSDNAEYQYAGNVQVQRIYGAECFPVGTTEDEVIEVLRQRGRKTYSIPSGASLHPLGGLGYARWAFQLLEREKTLGVTFDVIGLTTGSGSTIGGMIAGFKLAQKMGLPGAKKRLIGFSILRSDKEELTELVLGITKTAAAKIGVPPEEISTDDFELNFDFMGEAYGKLNERTMEGIKELARLEGILTDPVYTGKSFTGLLHTARSGSFSGKNVLFVHTGGQIALSAYPQMQ